MSTQNTAPDFGEPWRDQMGNIRDRMEFFVTCKSPKTAARVIACVNACAGMQDPASEIQAMRAELQKTRKLLADANRGAERNAHINNSLAGQLNEARGENEAMRAAIREAHGAFKVSLIRAYTAGYQHGHEATVEGGFIPVHHSDETEFHAENIHQMLCDGSLPESSALSKLQPFLP